MDIYILTLKAFRRVIIYHNPAVGKKYSTNLAERGFPTPIYFQLSDDFYHSLSVSSLVFIIALKSIPLERASIG